MIETSIRTTAWKLCGDLLDSYGKLTRDGRTGTVWIKPLSQTCHASKMLHSVIVTSDCLSWTPPRCKPSVRPVGDGKRPRDGRTLFVKPLSTVVPFTCSVQPQVHCANLLRRETLVQYSDNMLSCQISAARPKPLGTSVCEGQHLRRTDLSPGSRQRLGCHMRSPVTILTCLRVRLERPGSREKPTIQSTGSD